MNRFLSWAQGGSLYSDAATLPHPYLSLVIRAEWIAWPMQCMFWDCKAFICMTCASTSQA